MLCYLIQPKHLVRTRKRLMYCQRLSLSISPKHHHHPPPVPLCPFLCSPRSLMTLVSDARLYLLRRGRGKRYPDEPESYQPAIHLPFPSPVLHFVTLITVIHEICSTVFSGWHALITETKTHLIHLKWMHETRVSNTDWPAHAHTHTHTPALIQGCVQRMWVRACALGGALSRYQVVFPSAPERALIVLLFNLLVILDARQEPFTQT